MKFKKSFIFGTSLLLSSTAVASSNNLFETNELGNTKSLKEAMVQSNNLENSCESTILAPLELCCAYGDSKWYKKSERKWRREMRRQKRRDRRNSRK